MRASHGFGALIIVGMCAWSVEPNAAQDVRTRATPVEPIGEIADLFDTYDVVAIGEGPHNNLQGHQFRLALIRDPRFRAAATDIIVEFGNSRYQGLMDEFTRGADVPVTSLRRVWQDTVAATPVWESPIYEEFFRAVRAINMSLSEERKLRVLLGDPPIDWDIITSGEELRKWGFARDRHAADVIRREVVDKGRHALMIYGDGHLQGRSERPPRSLAAQLEANGTKVFLRRTLKCGCVDCRLADPRQWTVCASVPCRNSKRPELASTVSTATSPRSFMCGVTGTVQSFGSWFAINTAARPRSMIGTGGVAVFISLTRARSRGESVSSSP